MGSYLVLADWISIHAPARGATDRRRTGRYQGYFNPRSREGSDDRVPAAYVHQRLFQSTLPRGERRAGFLGYVWRIYFNPRSREGSDAAVAACASDYFEFQSTLPRGERPPGNTVSARAVYFNPRSREGSDVKIGVKSINAGISIHAPARGATADTVAMGQGKLQFQSTLPRGERHKMFCRELHPPQYFNPRSREGSDQILAPLFRMIAHFNPRSREGSDQSKCSSLLYHDNFNPRSREGSDPLLLCITLG